MSTDPFTTTVKGMPAGAAPRKAVRRAALARLAFGSVPSSVAAQSLGPRHLAFLPPEALELDLDDPQQCQFGDYELLSKLGQGGMGVVYRARQRSLDREVAVKLLSAGPWASSDFIERFRREAQSAARMQHPNIVAIYEIGAHDELNFFSMRLVQGISLAHELQESGPLPPKRAAQLLRTIAEALDYAHRLGVLHLDLKPANVLIDERGEPQVADFGLARRLDETLTRDNDEVSGTPSYMAPEQAQIHSHKLSQATDIYGLGAILYELLTGRPPFLAATPHETLKSVIFETPAAPRQLRAEIPADLEAICLKCLAKEPGERYSSARALGEDLGRFIDGRPVSVRPLNALQRTARWARREPRVTAIAAAFVLTLIVAVVGIAQQWRRAEHGGVVARERLWASRLDAAYREMLRFGPAAALPAVAANLLEQEQAGDHAAAERSRTRVGALIAQSPQLIDVIATGDVARALALDPAGNWIASASSNGKVHLIDRATGSERWSADAVSAMHFLPAPKLGNLRVSSDGRTLIAAPESRPGLPEPIGIDEVLIDAASGALRLPPADRFPGIRAVGFSPDGDFAAIWTHSEPAGADRLQVVRSDGWEPIGPARAVEFPVSLLAPGGATLALAQESFTQVQLLDTRSLQVNREYMHPDRSAIRGWRYAHHGNLLALSFQNGDVVVLDVAGGATHALGPAAATPARSVAFSEDDAWLAVEFTNGSVRVWDLATRSLLCEPIHGQDAPLRPGDEATHLQLDRARRTLLTAYRGKAMLWSLPEQYGPARAEVAMPRYPRVIEPKANAIDPGSGLMVQAATDGEIRVWRLRDRGPTPYLSAPLSVNESDPPFDGSHVLHVEGPRLRVMDLARGLPAAPDVVLPQDVSFAELVAGTGILVSTSGRLLHRHDWPSGRELGPAIELENSPTALVLDPRGRSVLVRFSTHDAHGNHDVLQTYDVRSGMRLGHVVIPGPQMVVQYSANGAQVLTSLRDHWSVFDTASLVRRLDAADVGALPGGKSPFTLVRMGLEGRTLWVTGGAEKLRLFALDVSGRRVVRGWTLLAPPKSIMPVLDGRRLALMPADSENLRLFDLDGGVRSIDAPGSNGVGGFAVSGDGRRLAMARARGALVFDAASGEWLGPPTDFVLDRDDWVFGLALDAHGEKVLARTRKGHLLLQLLPADRRRPEEIARIAALLSPSDEDAAAEFAPPRAPELRAALRAADPGPPRSSAATLAATGDSAAQTDAAANQDPRFVDLAPACNVDAGFEPRIDRILPDGVHRLLGVDYDVRCAITVPMAEGGVPKEVAQVPIELPRVAALNLLITGNSMIRDRAVVPYAVLQLHYRDGTRERLPIVYREQLVEWWWSDAEPLSARLAFGGAGARASSSGTERPHLFTVRLANPHPERALASFVLEGTTQEWSSPLLLAVTLEAQSEPAAPSGWAGLADMPDDASAAHSETRHGDEH